jgi:hypothetical protein
MPDLGRAKNCVLWAGLLGTAQMYTYTGDPRHLRRLPCEHVGICLEKGDEREFLFFLQITRNASGLGGIRAELDGHDGDPICSGWLHLWHLGGCLGTGGRGVKGKCALGPFLYCFGD